MTIFPAALYEDFPVGLVLEGGIGLALLAITRDHVRFEIAKMGVHGLPATSLTHRMRRRRHDKSSLWRQHRQIGFVPPPSARRRIPAACRSPHSPTMTTIGTRGAQNDRPPVSRLTNIGMPADSCDRIPTPEGECFDPSAF